MLLLMAPKGDFNNVPSDFTLGVRPDFYVFEYIIYIIIFGRNRIKIIIY